MKKNKSKNKKQLNKELFVIAIIVLIIIALWFSLIQVSHKVNEKSTEMVNSQITTEDKLLEKDKMIEELTNQINELKTQQEELLNKQTELETKNNELEEQIEKVRVSKANKKSTVTTRSGTTTTRTSETTTTTSDSNAKWIWANVSAYCSCSKCCGGYSNGITAMGTTATAGKTIAAPSNYAFGTKIEIQDMGIYTVEDRGGAITGNKIDVYFNTHAEALAFGRQQLQIRVVE